MNVLYVCVLQNSSELRTFVMVFLGLFVALPLGLLRNVESLSNISAISLGFYMVFVTEVSNNLFQQNLGVYDTFFLSELLSNACRDVLMQTTVSGFEIFLVHISTEL